MRTMVVLLSIGACSPVWGQAAGPLAPQGPAGNGAVTQPAGKAPNAPVDWLRAISNQLRSSDAEQVKQALASVRSLNATRLELASAYGTSAYALRDLATGLVAMKEYDEAERVLLLGLLGNDAAANDAAILQEVRIRIKLLTNKPQEALADAKGYYNVCPMEQTNKAVELICMCLAAVERANKSTEGKARQFRLQQAKGSTAVTQPAVLDEKSIFAELKVDPTPYQAAIERLTQESIMRDDFKLLIRLGNLMLLADQPGGAAECFNRANSMVTSEQQLNMATEALARAMRAEDGTAGRASQWLASVRPSETKAK